MALERVNCMEMHKAFRDRATSREETHECISVAAFVFMKDTVHCDSMLTPS